MERFESRGNPLRTSTTLLAFDLHRVPARAETPRVETISVTSNAGGRKRTAPQADSRWQTRAVAGLLVLLLLVGGGASYFAGGDSSAGAHQDASHDVPAPRRVSVATPSHEGGQPLVLPATLRPFQSTEIFARVNGYLKTWHVDIGGHVQEGQLLAEIDTPELDQELSQAKAQHQHAEAEVLEAYAGLDEAKADVALSKANYDRAAALYALAKSTRDRNYHLILKGAISEQEYDETQRAFEARYAEAKAAQADVKRREVSVETRTAMIRSREATVASLAANVKRLEELQSFKRVVAPFDGVVTRRTAENGMLVSAGTNSNASLFSISQHDRLRVQIDVPQSFAAGIAADQSASITSPEYPGRTFEGRIARTANAVDTSSRTLLVEIELDNRTGTLLPGGYAEVELVANRSSGDLRIPTSTLLIRPSGTFVASVGAGEKLQIKPVKLGRDHGDVIDVLGGLEGGERLVINPADDLANGETVKVQSTASVAEVAANADLRGAE
jgi:RND family efflux transporter MFP subunit